MYSAKQIPAPFLGKEKRTTNTQRPPLNATENTHTPAPPKKEAAPLPAALLLFLLFSK